MTEFTNYFIPVNNTKNKPFSEGSFGERFAFNNEFNNEIQVALISISETRNSYTGKYNTNTNLIRSYLYKLTNIDKINITDLGELKSGNSVKDTYASVKDVTNYLLQKNIIPVFFGGSQDLTIPLLRGFNNLHNEIELTVVDAKIDAIDNEFHSQSYLNQINNEFNNVFISVLGYQSYFVPKQIIATAEKNSWDLYRLGLIRNNFKQIEPILRDSDIVSFDLSSVRQSDNPGAVFQSPNGLYAEEACQLANLSGISDKIKVFSFFEYNHDNDIQKNSAHLSAQIIWYFLFGISQREKDYPIKNLNAYKKIFVKIEKTDSELIFYKNPINNRFWVEIPVKKGETKIISCSENDYIKACNNEISDRIWKNISRNF